MNKKDYINAIDEIKASDALKKKTINNIKETKKSKVNLIKFVSVAAVFIMVISISFMNRKEVNPNEDVIQKQQIAKLPTVGSYENLKSMVKVDSTSRYYDTKNGALVNDLALIESAETMKSESIDASTTNVQVAGVDEADIVKTDGKYIYYLTDNTVVIVKVDGLEVVKKIEYEKEDMYAREIYINSNKLIVIGTLNKREQEKRAFFGIGEDDSYSYYKTYTKTIVYNIENIENPKIEREVKIEGSRVSSRMIGDTIYLVSNKSIYAELMRDDEKGILPTYEDTAIGNSTKCIGYDDVYYFPDFEEANYLIVASFELSDSNKEANVNTYLGSGNKIYCSKDSLYVSNRKGTETQVYKFKLDKSNVEYIDNATIPGYINNQFSMDEYNGYFRIATTLNSKETDNKNVNNMYILDENLELVGQIENLAPGEKIYSVRYMGNKAYMVTFKQVDPLFVIDLSDVKNPKVLGQLKIPGYSKYLHPYDENHIIGFGEDTEELGENRVVTTGLKMALFDVSDVNNPIEKYVTKIGEKGSYSELLSDHKALLFSKEKNIIAFPASIREEQNNSKYYGKVTFKGAIVYGLTLENGFEEKGKISNGEKVDYENSVRRIIFVGDNLYTLSNKSIKATNMNTMEKVGEVYI